MCNAYVCLCVCEQYIRSASFKQCVFNDESGRFPRANHCDTIKKIQVNNFFYQNHFTSTTLLSKVTKLTKINKSEA